MVKELRAAFPGISVSYNGNVMTELEKYIIVEILNVEDGARYGMTLERNFQDGNFCETYGDYGRIIDCTDAGCYNLSNFGSDAPKDCVRELCKHFGIEFDSIQSINDFIQEVEGEQKKFIEKWAEANNSHTQAKYWDFWDGSNHATIVLKTDFDEGNEVAEVSYEDQIEMLIEFPGVPHISNQSTQIETENYLWNFDLFAENPWTCIITRKQ